jgi:hypothetical protein
MLGGADMPGMICLLSSSAFSSVPRSRGLTVWPPHNFVRLCWIVRIECEHQQYSYGFDQIRNEVYPAALRQHHGWGCILLLLSLKLCRDHGKTAPLRSHRRSLVDPTRTDYDALECHNGLHRGMKKAVVSWRRRCHLRASLLPHHVSAALLLMEYWQSG